MKHPIKVCVRFRPTANFAQDQIFIDQDKNSIAIHQRDGEEREILNNRQDSWSFRFHQVLHNAGQETVYETAQDIVHATMDGVNGTIMAYGQTGAGKTFTMIGDTGNYKHRGVSPRAIAQVFSEIAARPEFQFTVSVSYMELYNEKIFDLLDDSEGFMQKSASPRKQRSADVGASERKDFAVVEDVRGGRGTYVKDLTQIPVMTEEEALQLLFQGETARTVAEHQLNNRSNRSHCIFTLYITQRSRLASSEKVLSSKLHLVDLAGSERLKKTVEERAGGSSAHARMSATARANLDSTIKRESMYINKSLTYLEQCVVALTSRNRQHIPYRQTKLTNVLKDSLGGNCNTMMISCVWGERQHIEETVSTLKLAGRMMRVENQTALNVNMDPALLVKKYERQLRALKQELMMHDALVERSGVTYDEYTPEQRHELASQVRTYLAAGPEEEERVFDIVSLRQVWEIFRQFKIIVNNARSDAETKLRNEFVLTNKGAAAPAGGGGAGGGGPLASPGARASPAAAAQPTEAGDATNAGFVGDLETVGGYSVGTAPPGARPISVEGLRPSSASGATAGGNGLMGGPPASQPGGAASPSGGAPSPKQPSVAAGSGIAAVRAAGASGAAPAAMGEGDQARLYELFKSGVGAEQNQRLKSAKVSIRQCRAQCRTLTASVNECKRAIDDLTSRLDAKKADRSAFSNNNPASGQGAGGEDIVDEEEFRLLRELQDAKRGYRAAFDSLRTTRNQMRANEKEAARARAQQLASFNEWVAGGTQPLVVDPTSPSVRGAPSPGAPIGSPFVPSADSPAPPGGDDDDVLDDGEQFDKLEMERVVQEDPDSLAFFKAQKQYRSAISRNQGKMTKAMRAKRR